MMEIDRSDNKMLLHAINESRGQSNKSNPDYIVKKCQSVAQMHRQKKSWV